MPKWTFASKCYKIVRVQVEADTRKEAEEIAEKRIEEFVDDEEFAGWERDRYRLHGKDDEYPNFVTWSNKRD